jgi:hypothetical protein
MGVFEIIEPALEMDRRILLIPLSKPLKFTFKSISDLILALC